MSTLHVPECVLEAFIIIITTMVWDSYHSNITDEAIGSGCLSILTKLLRQLHIWAGILTSADDSRSQALPCKNNFWGFGLVIWIQMTFFPCFEYFFTREPIFSKFLRYTVAAIEEKWAQKTGYLEPLSTSKQKSILSSPFTKCTEHTKCFGYYGIFLFVCF